MLYNLSFDAINSEVFARILISRKALWHICDVKKMRLENGLPTSVNYGVIIQFHDGSNLRNFAYAKHRETRTLKKISEFTAPVDNME